MSVPHWRCAPRAAFGHVAAMLLAFSLPAALAATPSGSGEVRTATASPDQGEALGGRYVVALEEPALAGYRGGRSGLQAPNRRPGSNRLDPKGAASRAYVEHLRQRQAAFESKSASLLGRPVSASLRMQHALNAVVLELSPDEARRIAALPEVKLVDPDRIQTVDTDTGPGLIGAAPIWDGSNPGSSSPAQGEGMVIGVIDTGINFGSPSFAALGPVDGYVQVNPLGDGNYLGTCGPGGVDEGRCNAKLIGGYDFVCSAPVNACSNAGLREEPGFGDTNSHGSHVASTVAGHHRDATYAGGIRRISGVAPHASIIAYDACYTNIATGQGSCPNVSTAAAVDQAVADGIVDVINFSIGGGTSPWTDATSLAFLNATDAGIYVATSAGNSGPGANTTGHMQPWVSTTAASQHGRAGFSPLLQVSGPQPVPSALANLLLNLGSDGVPLSAAIPPATPLRVSAGFDSATDGCDPYPAGAFTGAIAVVRRGTCSFSIKVDNAAAAGAVVVIIANNAAGTIIPSVPATTVPVFSVGQTEGNLLRDFVQANPASATAGITHPPVALSNTVDQLGDFSSRGPAGNFDLMKPDITAPGVDILAVVAGTALTGSEQAVDLMSGTSMASPHHAGAALLVRQLKPTWAPPEVKAALQMTTTRAVTDWNGTPAHPHAMGSGRVRVDQAANAGLLLHETLANFTSANPGAGGDPAALNLASLARRYCIFECQFVRRFRNPGSSAAEWTASLTGLPGTVSPDSFTLAPGASIDVTVTVDSSGLPYDGVFRHGWVEMRRNGGGSGGELNLPVVISVPPPVGTVSPQQQTLAVVAGSTANASVTLANSGGFPLSFAVQNTGSGVLKVVDNNSTGVSSGFRSTTYTDPASAGSLAQFAADDFVLPTATRITSLFAQGFTVSNALITSAATHLTFAIYPDAGGLPAGNPQTNPAAAVWTYTTTPIGSGVTTVGSSDIELDLNAAGQNVNLPPGRYWLVVATRGTFANRFAWYGSNSGSGNPGFATITIANNGTGNWVSNPSFPGLTMRVRGEVGCDYPWVGASVPDTGSIPRNASQPVSVTLGPVTAGTHHGVLCFATNDPASPTLASLFTLNASAPNLVFTTAPSATATVGTAFAAQPVVTAQTSGGATLPGFNEAVTLELASGSGTLECDENPVQAVNGVAAFSGCRIDTVGTFTLNARSTSVTTSTTTPQVVVSAGAPARLVFAPAPSSTATAGAAFAQQPALRIEDALGNLVTASTNAVTLALASGSGPLICDQNPVNAVAGIATFSGCRIEAAGNVTLDASTATIASAQTQPAVAVSPAAPAQLDFTTAPSATATVHAAFATQPVVMVRDAFGNTVTGTSEPVSLVLATGSGTLSCNVNPVTPVNGVASFSGCSLDTVGTVILGASTASVAASSSTPTVVVSPGAPAQLVFDPAPSAAAVAGQMFPTQPAVRLEDAYGNLVTGTPMAITLAVASGGGTLDCDANPVTTVNGIATFLGCHIDQAGTMTINASAAGIATSTTQPQVAVQAAAASQLVFVTAPSATATAGQPFALQPVVRVEDAFGNPVTATPTDVSLALASGSGSIACDANPVTTANGVASFTGCRIDLAGTVTINASSAGVATSTSQPQVVVSAAGANRLVFVTAPSAGATAGEAFALQPAVQLEDAFGNAVTDTPTAITLSLASGSGSIDCDANPVTTVNGIATFAGCHIDQAGTVTLNASSAAIAASSTQPQVVVSAAATSRLVFVTTPSSTATAGQLFATQPSVRLEDAFGNPVTDAPTAISLALASGSGSIDCDANPVTTANGVASFAGCHIDQAGTVTINASSAGIAASTTQPQVVVSAAAASQLVFVTAPSATATAGQPFATQPVLVIQDAFGNAVTDAVTPVTLRIVGGGNVACNANPVTPVAGVASFAGCHIDEAGTVNVDASAGAIASATSSPQIVVGAAAAGRLVFAVDPASTAVAGEAWTMQPVIRIEDALGNTVTDASTPVTLAIASGQGPLSCDSNPVMPVAGVATFSGCRITSAGQVTLTASTAAIASSTTTPAISISAAGASQLVFTTLPPTVATVAAPWPQQPVVTIQDAFGNVVTDASTPVTLALASGTGPLQCSTNPVTPVAGVAQFAGCRIGTVGVVTLTTSTSDIASSTTQPQVRVALASQSQGPVMVPATDRWALLLAMAALAVVAAAALRRR